jgi:heme a synthase
MSSTGTLSVSAQDTRALSRFAWAVLVYNVAVILLGAVVRATSSGAGCGDHWPLCNGTVLQSHPRLATLIELSHRMTSGVTVIAIALLLVWTFRRTRAGHLARIAVVAATVFIFIEALLGALLVLLHLTADNQSPARAAYLSLHLANTLLLLAALTLCAYFLSPGKVFDRRQVQYRHVSIAGMGLGAIVLVGMTGTLAALSDTLFPAASFRAALAQDFAPGSIWLQHLRLLHPASAIVAALFVGWLLLRTREQKLAQVILLLLALQCALGVADVVLLAPLWLQITHLFGADLLWISLVLLAAKVCITTSPVGTAENSPGRQSWV